MDVQGPAAAGEAIEVRANAVTPEYFDALGMRPRQGRFFTRDEAESTTSGAGSPIVISAGLARRLFGAANPIDLRVVLPKTSRQPARELTVVGVAEDIHWNSVSQPSDLFLYLPFRSPEFGVRRATLIVKSALPFRDLRRHVDAAARDVDPTLPIRLSAPISVSIDRALGDRPVFAWILSLLGWLGFALAAVGLYGLLAQSVAERTREFGIRMAIGGSRARIFGMVLRQAMWIGTIGAAAGVVLAVYGSRLIARQLFGVTSLEPTVYLGSSVALVLIVLIASLWPARTATRIEPVEALRME
jgi:ABC-type lipoprotein release transport system permease subunit